MTKARYDLAQVTAAFALPLVLVAVAGWFSWSETWARAEGELYRTVDGAAEYSERLFASAYLAGRLADRLLAEASDEEIRQHEAHYHGLLAEVIPDLPGSISINVSDRAGQMLLTSTLLPTPPVSVADREWVLALQDPEPPPVYVGALTVGRVHGQLFFSLSLPRRHSGNDLAPGAYDGLLNIAFDPYAVAAELATTTHEATDVIALVRADGEVLTTTGGLSPAGPRVPPTSPLFAAIEAGEVRGLYEGRALGIRDGLAAGRGLQIAFRQVGELPVYVTVSRSPAAIVAAWWGRIAWLLAVGVPTSLALGMMSLTALRRKNALAANQAELDASFDSAAIGTALLDRASRRILKANRRLCEMAGRDAAQLAGMTLDQLLDADAADGAGGEASAPGLARLQRPDGGTRLVETTTAPVPRTRRNAAELIIATFQDITERKEAEERQALLAREVDHRAKNVLAIVQGVIRLAREPSSAEFADKIEGRIRALARAHELLARDHWEGTELVDLLRDELAPYRDGAKVPMRGPAVRIAAHAVQPLSMALHELATNAVKHGALKSAAGGLSISWLREAPDGGVVLNWEEHTDHPPKPGAEGTGLNILQASVDDLGGTLTLDWRDTGLACRIALPPDVLASGRHASGEPALQAARDGGRPKCTASLSGARVMLVEDEVIVALDMKAMLEDLGCQVLGPASSLAAAQALASREARRIDAALLDVNLKGETTLELAQKLRAAGVACIFVTGYSVLPDAAEADWLLLQKPVTGGELAAALQLALGGAICQEKRTS